MSRAAKVVRSMSISRSEFFRTLPDALGTNALQVAGDRTSVDTAAGRMEVRFREEAPLRVGSLELPFARVELHFEGYDEAGIAAVMQRFDLYFRRGGG